MRVVAIIQARLGSTRLPGKVLMTLGDRTVLAQVIRRVQASRRVDQVVVATSTLAQDEAVATAAVVADAAVSRGSESDVLGRYHLAAVEHEAEVVVRVTSDCPLFDPELLDRMLGEFLAAQAGDSPFDYYSNTLGTRTYPTGLDAEIFTMKALECAASEATRPFEREHVTPYFYQHPDRFRLGGMAAAVDHSSCRWTLDTPEDLTLLRHIYATLSGGERLITTQEVLGLMAAEPELALINSEVEVKPLETGPSVVGELLIRADASPEIGAGHLLRCLALAQAWPGDVCFAMAEGADSNRARLRDEGFNVVTITAPVASAADAAATVALASARSAQWLVVDGYRFDNAYFSVLSGAACRILLLDDCGRKELPPLDLVLNLNLQGTPALYPGRSPQTQLLLGVEHVLLRREFLAPAATAAARDQTALRVLVTLGGGDPDNVTLRIIDALSQAGAVGLQVKALVATGSPHEEALQSKAASSDGAITVLTGVTDMPSQYRWADCAITAGGGTLWELAYMGVPALTVVMADNQEAGSRLLATRGVISCLGRPENLSDDELARACRKFLGGESGWRDMIAAGRELIDGQGSQRVVAAMLADKTDEVTA